MKTLPSLLSSALTLALVGCTSTLYTVEHGKNLEGGQGIIYALPKKQLIAMFDVTTTRTRYGQWSCLNPSLGLPAITNHDQLCGATAAKSADGRPEDKVEHELSGQRIAEQVLPDPGCIYRIKLDTSERNRSRTVKFVLSDDGRLASSDALLVDARPEMTAAGIRTGANVVGKVVSLIVGSPGSIASTSLDKDNKGNKDNKDQLTASCEEFRDACSAAKRLRELIAERDKLLVNATASLLLTSEGELVRVSRLDAEITALEKLFYPTYIKTVTTWTKLVEPELDTTAAWCFDPSTGVIGPDAQCKPGNQLELSIRLPDPNSSKKKSDDAQGQGIRYRVPQWVQLSLTSGGRPVLTQLTTIPQFGAVQVLPNEVHGRKNQLVVELSPTTGMLVRFEFVDERNYADVIDALGEGSSTLLDAAAAAEASASSSEVDDKKQQLERLELDRQIGCYETQGGPC